MEFAEKRSLYYRTLFWTLFLSCILLRAAYGETHYVTDILILNLREGPGIDHKVIRTLKSNMPVEILEESDRYLNAKVLILKALMSRHIVIFGSVSIKTEKKLIKFRILA